jgi:hypothetical protein
VNHTCSKQECHHTCSKASKLPTRVGSAPADPVANATEPLGGRGGARSPGRQGRTDLLHTPADEGIMPAATAGGHADPPPLRKGPRGNGGGAVTGQVGRIDPTNSKP